MFQNPSLNEIYRNFRSNTNIIQDPKNNDIINNIFDNNRSIVDDDKFYNLTKDNEQKNFMDLKNCNNSEEENQNINDIVNNIYTPSDIKIKEEENKKDNINISQLKTAPKTLFKTSKQNDEKDKYEYEYEKEKAMIKARTSLLKYGRKKLNKLIKNSPHLPQKYKTREKIIHPASNYITPKVSNGFNKKFWKMKFKRILTYGKNRITKNNAIYKNDLNIKDIINYIKDYQVKNNILPPDLRSIKNLLYLKSLGLIKKFVKSKDFIKFKKKDHIEIDRIGIKREINIDIFTESGFIDLLKPFEDNKSKDLKKKDKNMRKYSAFRECFHYRHVRNDN